MGRDLTEVVVWGYLLTLGYREAEPPAPFRFVWGLFVLLLLVGAAFGACFSAVGQDDDALYAATYCWVGSGCYLLGGLANRARWWLWCRGEKRELDRR